MTTQKTPRKFDTDKVTLENLDMQFCSNFLKDEFRRLLEENAKLKDNCDGLYADLIGQEHLMGTKIEIQEMKIKNLECVYEAASLANIQLGTYNDPGKAFGILNSALCDMEE